MAEKFEETAIIIRQEEIADDIYSMWCTLTRLRHMRKQDSLFLFIVMMEADCFQDRSVFVRLIKRMAQSVWCIVAGERNSRIFRHAYRRTASHCRAS